MGRSKKWVAGGLGVLASIGAALGVAGVEKVGAVEGQAASVAGGGRSASGGDIVNVASQAGQFKTLLAAAEAAGLVEALKGAGPLTVFAPTDEAFAKLPPGTVEQLLRPENRAKLADILKYHVVSGLVPASRATWMSGVVSLQGQRLEFSKRGESLMVDGATVVMADVPASNGVIHVIDRVILPTDETIVSVASKAGSFGTLLTAARAAGLASALEGEGPLTVLAPTDEAFTRLPAGTVESLLSPENKAKLESILKYHVIAGRLSAKDALSQGAVKTLQGGEVVFDLNQGVLTVNGARVIRTDIDAKNGLILVIDAVLLPR